MIDVERTIISQYGQSATITQLIRGMNECIDPRADLDAFLAFVWNVDTAQSWGLDIWGRIVGVSRLLRIAGADPIVGFDNASVPFDWTPMSQGRFARNNEGSGGQAYVLDDDAYRVLILTKALSNISATDSRSLNRLLQNLFPNRGRVYVRDLGHMEMQFVFNFALTPVERAIVQQSGVLPHPAGVLYSVVIIPIYTLFGFYGDPSFLPFNQGVFQSRLN